MQILLVDDEPLELFLSKRFLGMEYKVEAFGSLPEALQWAQTHAFDVLVSDYHLGAIHAPDVLRELVALKGKTFKAYVLTNHVNPGQEDEMKSVGYDGVIEKPLSMEKFKAVAGL